jgi:hypothetical protein
MSSYASKALVICAFALIWLIARDHVRASLLGYPLEITCSESDDSRQSQEVQDVFYIEPSLCLALEPAPDFAALGKIAALAHRATVSVSSQKRGPPTVDSGRS